jgi:diguanylate cyclase (GGDEF)-like protein
MAGEPESEFASAAELLLVARLARCREAFEARRAGPIGESLPRVERGLLLNSMSEVVGHDAQRTLGALADVMRAFAVEPSAAWIQSTLDGYIDRVAQTLTAALAGTGPAGALATPAEQRQIDNLRSRVKAALRDDIARAAAAAAAERRAPASDPAAAGDLDDRLPLRRRGAFDRDLVEVVTAARPDQPASLVMIDIDHFKKVNDEHGHPAGDEVLQDLAARVVHRTGAKGRAYRYGGEELALLLPRYSPEEAAGLAERLRQDVANVPIGRRALAVTASFGVAAAPDHARDAHGLLARADEALYAAKHEGRNCVRTAR